MNEQEFADDLAEEGFALIDDLEPEGAIQVAKRLKKLGHPAAWELLALGHTEMGRPDMALSVLEMGVKKAPDAWRLWHLLGNYYSDDERWAEAERAYRHSLECPEVEGDWVRLNTAILFARQNRFADALAVLGEAAPTDPELEWRCEILRVRVLNESELYPEALLVAEDLEGRIPEDASADQAAELHAELAVALWGMGSDRAAALERAWQAIGLSKREPRARWLIREIEGEISPKNRYFRVTVEGAWPHHSAREAGPVDFFTTYEVVAENPEQALTLLSRFEPEEVRPSLRIESCEEVESRPDDPSGVYGGTGYVFSEPESDR